MQPGKLFRSIRWLGRLITTQYQIIHHELLAEPAVYLCRHLGQHGPIVSVLWLPQIPRFWCLHVYIDKQACRRHFADYTLSQRLNLPKWLAKLLAYPVGAVMHAICLSANAIPVYRDRNSFKTMSVSLKALQDNQDILIFPNIDYTKHDGGDELYDGFLYLERFYYKTTEQHLAFVPIYIDDDEQQIIIGKAIRFDDTDFDAQKPALLQRINNALDGKFAENAEESMQ